MRFLIFLLLAFGFWACSPLAYKAHEEIGPYITGKDLGTTDSEEIKINLTRVGYMAGGQYELEIFPITLPYLEAKARELGRQRGLTEEQIGKILKKQRKDLVDFKVCFDLAYSIVKFEQVAKLKKWTLEFIDDKGYKYPLTWNKTDLRKRPVVELFNGLYGKQEKWWNQGVGCTQIDYKLEKGFKLQVTPSFVQWPFPPTTTLAWGLKPPPKQR